MRSTFCLSAVAAFTLATATSFAATTAAPSAAPAPAAKPATPPPVALPAFVDVVTFAAHFDGSDHKIVTMTAPNILRLDEPVDGYSVIYDPQTQHYTGLENRNYTYWEFSWPEVRDAVAGSKRYEAHLQDLSNQGLGADDSTSASSSTSAGSSVTTSASGPGDDSGYVWRPTTDKKKIAGYDCMGWTGDSVSNGSVEAWCYAGPVPKVQAAIEQLRTINSPMALVPVREVAPDFIFPIYDSLTKAGVTPLLITWGDQQQTSHFELVKVETKETKPQLFSVPKLYMKTTLVTMDGILDQPK